MCLGLGSCSGPRAPPPYPPPPPCSSFTPCLGLQGSRGTGWLSRRQGAGTRLASAAGPAQGGEAGISGPEAMDTAQVPPPARVPGGKRLPQRRRVAFSPGRPGPGAGGPVTRRRHSSPAISSSSWMCPEPSAATGPSPRQEPSSQPAGGTRAPGVVRAAGPARGWLSSLRGRRALAWRLPPGLHVQAEPGPCGLGHFLIPEHTARNRWKKPGTRVTSLLLARPSVAPLPHTPAGRPRPQLPGVPTVSEHLLGSHIPRPCSEEGHLVLTWPRPTLAL